ncbi:tRNA-dihydrouridine synthase [bacterium]|nr:tRNA-dihydrouridine synthase [bacterium]
MDHISNIIKGKALLAPMLAVTDIPFRSICRTFGAALTYTEMVSAAGIVNSSSQSYRNAVFPGDEHPVALQLVAADPELARAALRLLQPMQPDLFDINCGCPNERICEAGAGAQLLDDLPRFAAVIEASVRATDIPVTVKVRMKGLQAQTDVRSIVRAAEDSGASFITIHARERNAEYSEAANWEMLSLAASVASIPVVGNGDIFSADDAFRMMEETGVDAVMVARGSLGTPWIFRDINLQQRNTVHEAPPPNNELVSVVRRHLEHLLREFGEVRALPRIRKHVLWYARPYEGFDEIRRDVFQTDTAENIIARAMENFENATPLPADSTLLLERETAFRERVLFWARGVLRAEG